MTENITAADIDAYRRGSSELTNTAQDLGQKVQNFLGEVSDPSVLGSRDTVGRYGNPMYRVAVGWVGRCLNELASAYQDHGQALAGSADGYQRNEELNGEQATRRGQLEQRDLTRGNALGTGWESPDLGADGSSRRGPGSDSGPVHQIPDANDLIDWPGGRRPGSDGADGLGDPSLRPGTVSAEQLDPDDRPGTSAAGLTNPSLGDRGPGTAPGSVSAAGLGGAGSPTAQSGAAGQPGVLNPHLGGANQASGHPGLRAPGAESGPGMMPPPAGGGRRDDRRGSDGSTQTDQHLAEDEDEETVWDTLAAGRLNQPPNNDQPQPTKQGGPR